ncbi:hypothetical protein D3C76_953220 [compost metagenome]
MRQRVAPDQRLGAGEAFLRGGQFRLALVDHRAGGGLLAFPLRHQRAGGELGVLLPAQFRLGLRQLGLEHLGIHARDHLAGLHEVALVDQDFRDTSGQLGRHVDLGGLDAAVAAGEAIAQPVRPECLPGECGDRGERHDDHATP